MWLQRALAEPALRLIAASVLVLTLAQHLSVDAVRVLLPAIRAEIQMLDRNYRVSSLDLVQEHSSSTVRLSANLARPIEVRGQRVVPLGWPPRPPGWYQVELNARGVLQSALALVMALLSWPNSITREALLRTALSVPALAVLIAIDAPLELLGNLQEVIARPFDPNGMRPLFFWGRFLEGGGNLALGLALAILVLTLSARAALGPAVIQLFTGRFFSRHRPRLPSA